MSKLVLAVCFLASVCAFGQNTVIDCPTNRDILICGNAVPAGTVLGCGCKPKAPKPLKCGKYEYATWGSNGGPMKEMCAPIMHEVTEKEWQELMARLKKLEVVWLKPIGPDSNGVYLCPEGSRVEPKGDSFGCAMQ